MSCEASESSRESVETAVIGALAELDGWKCSWLVQNE